MSKGKLAKFAELESFSIVVQPTFAEVYNNNFRIKGNWNKSFFKTSRPITLELGCGKGEYTIGLAQIYPDRNFIGIDIKGSRIWKGAKYALTNSIGNVGFLRTRIDFIESVFGPDEVEEIWITFPDPQLKKPAKRLISSRFLNRYKNFLIPGGWISLKTDSPELYKYALELIQYNDLEIDFATNDLYSSGYNNEILAIKTFYEKMWLEKGLKIHYIRFKLKGKHDLKEPPGQDGRSELLR